MQLRTPGIVIDYADEQWSVEDEAHGIVAYTTDPSAIYAIVQAFGAVQDDAADNGPYRDSGDEHKPHA